MDYVGIVMTKIYNTMTMVPKWMMYIITGGIGSVLIRFMHRAPKTPPNNAAPKPKPKAALAPAVDVPVQPPSVTTGTAVASPKATKRGGSRKR
jgi:hypothetical protein